jgi:hypothetical protein
MYWNLPAPVQHPLRELYQRDIDYDRIKKDIVNAYLKAENKLKFFNALTFIFFPRKADGSFSETFDPYDGNDPTIPIQDDNFDKQFAGIERTVFGGVQYVRLNMFARLRWDLNRVTAIAVDGQHRLTALRKWWEDKNQVLDSVEQETRIPVLFLMLHPSAGFATPAKKSLRLVARDIFTDLNKNAKKVDEAREIILDDRSLAAESVRRLVTMETSTDAEDRLPLSLVRWQEANNRFDQEYYLNSLLHLHQLVELVLQLEPPSDPLEPTQVRKYIGSLDSSLGGPDGHLSDGTMNLIDFYNKHYVLDEDKGIIRPFVHLPDDFLAAAAKQFEQYHKPYLIAATMRLKPYRELLEYCRSNNLIQGPFSRFLAQPAGHRKALEEVLEKTDPHWSDNNIDAHIQKIRKLKRVSDESKDTWLFKAIFQKALVRVFRKVVFENASAADRLGTMADIIAFVDKAYDRDLFRLTAPLPGSDFPLWAFIGVHHNTLKIKVNTKVERSIFSLLLLAYYANRKAAWDKAQGKPPVASATDLVRYFGSATSQGEAPPSLWPGCNDAAKILVTVFSQESGTWTKIPEDSEKAKDKKEREGRQRLASVLAQFAIDFSFPTAPTTAE